MTTRRASHSSESRNDRQERKICVISIDQVVDEHVGDSDPRTVTPLLERAPAMAAAGLGVMEPVFPSARLGWRSPANVQRAVRRLRERIGYPNFTTHVGRKTVATLLAEGGQSSRQVADQLRHSSIQVTEKHYIERGVLNPGAAKLIDAAHRPAT